MELDLYINTVYFGFHHLEKIEEYRQEYYKKAIEEAEKIDWDEVVLYAILAYNHETQECIAADFMCLRMPYPRYADLCSKISDNCRLFCVKNNKE